MDREAWIIDAVRSPRGKGKETGQELKYAGSPFHRVIPGFMAQGGCPNSREGAKGMPGTGGPGYMINCEINSKKHAPGILSMAHAGKNTGGSRAEAEGGSRASAFRP